MVELLDANNGKESFDHGDVAPDYESSDSQYLTLPWLEPNAFDRTNPPTPPCLTRQALEDAGEHEMLFNLPTYLSLKSWRDTANPSTNTSPPSHTPNLSKSTTAAEVAHDPIHYWVHNGCWPSLYFGQELQSLKTPDENPSPDDTDDRPNPVAQFLELSKYRDLVNDSAKSPEKNYSNLSKTNRSGLGQRTGRPVQYADPRFLSLLAASKSYMEPCKQGLDAERRRQCDELLMHQTDVPLNTLFSDSTFKATIDSLSSRNAARIMHDIGRLLVPSAETLGLQGAAHLRHLTENIREEWSEAIPFAGARPRPDYCVGFSDASFSPAQLAKLAPLVGAPWDWSLYNATHQMLFPFLIVEVAGGSGTGDNSGIIDALDVVERRNALAASAAVRGVLELARCAGRASDVDGREVAFSISHDARRVRINAHYARFVDASDKRDVHIHQCPLAAFDILEDDGAARWKCYRFVRALYDEWIPAHREWLASLIDDLPDAVDFDVQPLDAFVFGSPPASAVSGDAHAGVAAENDDDEDEDEDGPSESATDSDGESA